MNDLSICPTYQVGDEDRLTKQEAAVSPAQMPLNPGLGIQHLDPFQTLPVQVNPHKELLLRTFIDRLVPESTSSFSPETAEAYRKWVIPNALRTPMMPFAILGGTMQHLSVENNNLHLQITSRSENPPDITSTASTFERYKSPAIRNLATEMSGSGVVNSIAVYTISVLLRIEILDGNLDGIKAHISGLKQLFALGFDLSQYHPALVAPMLLHLLLHLYFSFCNDEDCLTRQTTSNYRLCFITNRSLRSITLP